MEATTTAGFEPAHPEDNRFQVCRLNHSAKLSTMELQIHWGYDIIILRKAKDIGQKKS